MAGTISFAVPAGRGTLPRQLSHLLAITQQRNTTFLSLQVTSHLKPLPYPEALRPLDGMLAHDSLPSSPAAAMLKHFVARNGFHCLLLNGDREHQCSSRTELYPPPRGVWRCADTDTGGVAEREAASLFAIRWGRRFGQPSPDETRVDTSVAAAFSYPNGSLTGCPTAGSRSKRGINMRLHALKTVIIALAHD